MLHECHPKLKTFTFRSELVLLCAKLEPAFLSDAINFDATSIVVLNAPNASKKSMIPLSFVIFQKYFFSCLFRVILPLILYLVTTWQKMFVSI